MLKTLKIHLFNSIIITIVLLGTAFLRPVFGSQEVARELFKAGKYAEALPLFEQLHQWYPNDETIQYELAVCLTETGQLGARPKKLLLQLSSDAFLPDRSLYLAKNFHAENEFETALTYYERYEAEANSKSRKKSGSDALKEACIQNKNPFVVLPAVQAESKDTIDLQESEPAQTQTDQQSYYDDPIIQLLNQQDSLVDIVVSPGIQYRSIHQFRTNNGRVAYIEGANLKVVLNRRIGETALLREAYLTAPDAESKQNIATTVTENEVQLIQLKATSDALMMQAIENEAAYWQQASDEERAILKAENESLEQMLAADIEMIEVTPYIPSENVPDDVNDTIDVEPSPVPVANIEEVSNRIIYKVQIGAYNKDLPQYIEKLHRKLSVLRKIDQHTDENGVTVYTIGEVVNIKDALSLQEQIRTEGVKDAFVVVYNNGKRITLREAKALNEE
jgi:tetratricopeptide (TPR) repeat protein